MFTEKYLMVIKIIYHMKAKQLTCFKTVVSQFSCCFHLKVNHVMCFKKTKKQNCLTNKESETNDLTAAINHSQPEVAGGGAIGRI